MMPLEPDHYAVLELAPGSPMEEVKSQYRRLAKRYHPDLHGNEARSQEKFRRINAAYTFLSDAPRKAAYDTRLQAAQKRAAQKRAAPSPKPAPPPRSSSRPPVVSRYQTPPAATGYHERISSPDLRMTRSAWLGATAGAVVVLLVIGLSWDGSDRGRPVPAGSLSPAVGAPAQPPDDGLDAGGSEADRSEADRSEPGGEADPAVALPDASPPDAPLPGASDIVPVGPPHAPPPRPSSGLPASERHLTEAITQRLLARYEAVLPRTDRLIAQGDSARAAVADPAGGSRRILRDQLTADLANLSSTRARVRPAIAGLSRQDTFEQLQEKVGPILADLRRLEDPEQSVQEDIRALASTAAPSAPRVRPAALPALHLSSPVASAPRIRPAAAAFVPIPPAAFAPVRSPAAPPSRPAPVIAATPKALDAPKPLVTAAKPKPLVTAAKPKPLVTAAKPKAPASVGQQFIMWGK